VPYNPFLLRKYQCHINVEVCSSVRACKYLYKYVYKGHDRAMARTESVGRDRNPNEIEDYIDFRCIGACEACWRIFDFELADRAPAVMALPVHLENGQRVYFRPGQEQQAVMQAPPATELTAFFDYNARHADDQVHHLYCDFPRHFTFDKREKMWNPRVRSQGGFPTVGRVHAVHPNAGDIFYLRLLLHNEHAKGKRSFSELRTANGVEYQTFQEACRTLGLLDDDSEWDQALNEASHTGMPSQLRRLFCVLVVFCNPADPKGLFEKYWVQMGEDYAHRMQTGSVNVSDAVLRTMVLIDIEQRLFSHGKTLTACMLPSVDSELRNRAAASERNLRQARQPSVFREETEYNAEEQRRMADEAMAKMQPSQRDMIDGVMQGLACGESFAAFVDAPAGTGKTFCFNAILALIRAEGRIALSVASSGIAATLLVGGRTFHSRFNAPLKPTDTSTCNIPAQSDLARLLREAALIVWDEAPMTHRYVLEALDRTLRDLTGSDGPVGGKPILLGGDFRQVLPVVKMGSRAQIVAACIKRSPLWAHFRVFHLRENMRVRRDGVTSQDAEQYARWVLDLGNGDLPADDDGMIEIPPQLCIKPSELIDWTFPNLTEYCHDQQWMLDRAILAAHNSVVGSINEEVTRRFPGQEVHCYSADRIIDDDHALAVPPEYLNSLNVAELPPHDLCLKPGMPVMLLRNLSHKDQLCNGTRLLVRQVHGNRLLEATNMRTGENVFIPRITLRPTDDTFPFEWERRQFPVRVAFAMTINKAQGQTYGELVFTWRDRSSRMGSSTLLHREPVTRETSALRSMSMVGAAP
jgi:hypothetical protein